MSREQWADLIGFIVVAPVFLALGWMMLAITPN